MTYVQAVYCEYAGQEQFTQAPFFHPWSFRRANSHAICAMKKGFLSAKKVPKQASQTTCGYTVPSIPDTSGLDTTAKVAWYHALLEARQTSAARRLVSSMENVALERCCDNIEEKAKRKALEILQGFDSKKGRPPIEAFLSLLCAGIEDAGLMAKVNKALHESLGKFGTMLLDVGALDENSLLFTNFSIGDQLEVLLFGRRSSCSMEHSTHRLSGCYTSAQRSQSSWDSVRSSLVFIYAPLKRRCGQPFVMETGWNSPTYHLNVHQPGKLVMIGQLCDALLSCCMVLCQKFLLKKLLEELDQLLLWWRMRRCCVVQWVVGVWIFSSTMFLKLAVPLPLCFRSTVPRNHGGVFAMQQQMKGRMWWTRKTVLRNWC